MTIDKGKRDTEIECLYKMGEACEIAKKLNLPISFSAQKGPDGSLKIEFLQYEEDEKMEEIDRNLIIQLLPIIFHKEESPQFFAQIIAAVRENLKIFQ